MSDNDKKEVRALLEKEFYDMIEEIQSYYGLNNVSVTLRLIIKRYYEDIFKIIKSENKV